MSGLTNSSNSSLDIVDQVAADEPDSDPKIPQPRIVVCISRPGTLLSQGERPSNISSDSLVRKRISPIQINMGRAASVQEAVEPQNAVKRFLPGGVPVKKAMPIQPTIASVMAIHTPPASSSSMMNSSSAAISISSILDDEKGGTPPF